MKRVLLLSVIGVFALCALSPALAQLHWARSYETAGDIWCCDVVTLSGGDFMVVGNVAPPLSKQACLVMRLNAQGGVIWQNLYPAMGFATSAWPGGGGCFVAGFTEEKKKRTAVIMFVEGAGHVTWAKKYESKGHHTEIAVVRHIAPNMLGTAGRIESLKAPHNQDYWVMLLNPDGSVVWQYAYDYSYDDGSGRKHADETATAITPLNQAHGFLVAGHLHTPLANHDLWIVPLSPAGDLNLPTIRVGGKGSDQVASMTQVAALPPKGHGYALSGLTTSHSAQQFRMFAAVFHVDPFAWQWARVYKPYRSKGDGYGYSIAQMADANLILAGSFFNPVKASFDAALLKLNLMTGTDLWGHSVLYGGHGHNDKFLSVRQSQGNDFVVVGSNKSFRVRQAIQFPMQPPGGFPKSALGPAPKFYSNGWVMHLDKNGSIDKNGNDDACMRQDEDVESFVLDWVPKCLPEPEQERSEPPIEVIPVKAKPEPVKLHSILLCKELKTNP